MTLLVGTQLTSEGATSAAEQTAASPSVVDGGGQLTEAARSRTAEAVDFRKRARGEDRVGRKDRSTPPAAASTTPTSPEPKPTAPAPQPTAEATTAPSRPVVEQEPATAPTPTAAPTPAPAPAPAPTGTGPMPVDLTPQGATRTATATAAGIVAAIDAAPAGSTVLVPGGSYGDVAVDRVVGSGTVRVQPAPGAAVTIASVDLTGASGLDWRGINTTGGVFFKNTARVQWRGGTHTLTERDTGFYFHSGSRDITVEDVTVRGADCSFYLQSADEASRPTNILIQRVRSEDVHQDHVFISRGSATIQDFVLHGHTESAEHQDGVQIVGGKDVTIRRGTMSNDRAFRDGAVDRNDHGVMINYTPGEGRVPENITLEDLDIHDMTSTGVAVAGVRGLSLNRVHAHDNGPGGGASDLVVDPDPGNVVTGLAEVGCTFSRRSVSGVS